MGIIPLEPSWLEHLREEFSKPYMKSLRRFLQEQRVAGKIIYPEVSEYFAALNATPFANVQVIIRSGSLS